MSDHYKKQYDELSKDNLTNRGHFTKGELGKVKVSDNSGELQEISISYSSQRSYDTPENGWDQNPSHLNKVRLISKQIQSVIEKGGAIMGDDSRDEFLDVLIYALKTSFDSHIKNKKG